MKEMTKMSENWITIICNKKKKNRFSKISIGKNGKVFIDGELYDESNPRYRNFNIDVQSHGRINTGEETREMIESQKKAKRRETVIIKDIKDNEKTETTKVKF